MSRPSTPEEIAASIAAETPPPASQPSVSFEHTVGKGGKFIVDVYNANAPDEVFVVSFEPQIVPLSSIDFDNYVEALISARAQARAAGGAA